MVVSYLYEHKLYLRVMLYACLLSNDSQFNNIEKSEPCFREIQKWSSDLPNENNFNKCSLLCLFFFFFMLTCYETWRSP